MITRHPSKTRIAGIDAGGSGADIGVNSQGEIKTESVSEKDILNRILCQLVKMNMQFELITDNEITHSDVAEEDVC